MLRLPDFDVDNLEGVSDREVKTFIDKLHDITENSVEAIGTSETHTDSLVDDLLRIGGLPTWETACRLRCFLMVVGCCDVTRM